MAEHTEQVQKLREIVIEIATEMELSKPDLLQDEVEELGKRLESVRQSISVLADIADARSNNEIECHQNIEVVKANLNEMRIVSSFNTKFLLLIFIGYFQIIFNDNNNNYVLVKF